MHHHHSDAHGLGGCKVGQGAVWQGISLEHSLHDHIPNQTDSGFLVWGMSEMRLHGLVELTSDFADK